MNWLLKGVFAFCLASSASSPPFVPKDLKNVYRSGYRKPSVIKAMNSGYTHFASEVRDIKQKKFFLLELAGFSQAPQERIWTVLKEVWNFQFLPFVKSTRKLPNRAKDGTQKVFIKVGVWGYHSQMWMRIKPCKLPDGSREVAFVVEDGHFKGLEGRLRMEPQKKKRFLVYMDAHWLTHKIPIPWIILKFGMEFALQRMGRAFLKEIKKV